MGLTLTDLFPDGTSAPERASSNGVHHAPLTLLDLALEKLLPWQFLFNLGVMEHPSGGLRIPYHLADGTLAPRSRLRTALIAREGSLWSKGKGKLVPYGLERLEEARKAGELVLVEGESDCWTLWYQGFPALGLPGAEMAGVTFVKALANRLKGWRWQGKAFVVHLPGVKDPSDLYRQDRKGFRTAFQQALAHAELLASMSGVPGGIDFALDWPRLGEGGLALLEDYLKEHPKVRLVVIDTWARAAPPSGERRRSQYEGDYEALIPLKRHLGLVVRDRRRRGSRSHASAPGDHRAAP